MTDSIPTADPVGTPGPTGLDGVTVALPDGTVVLDGFTLLAEPGELLVVLGPSGCGKTTLLRAVAGIQPVRKGRILIRGRDVTRVDPSARDIAMVFQGGKLLPTLDLARNMGFGLTIRRTDDDEVDRRVDRESRRMRIRHLLGRKPTEVSMGQRGQAGIGRALVREPAAFLMDEPLAHVDAQERGRMRRVIAETVRASGASTIYVTHDQTEALAIGDRVAVLDRGRVCQVGPGRELYARPASRFVADFVGAMPLGVVTARPVVAGGLAGYRVGDRILMTWQPLPASLADQVGRPVALGLRPEAVTAVPPHPDPDATVLSGRVRGIERTGRDTYLTVELACGRLVARFEGRSLVRVGDAVGVQVDAARAHVFDLATGSALHHPS